MDISNIHVGMIIKNYKQLCSLLNEPIKTGDSKKAQLKEWSRHFSYLKEGNKYIIEDIYSEPKEKAIKVGGNHNTIDYVDDIKIIVTGTLAHENRNGKIFLSKLSLLKEFNMINGNYAFGKRNVPKLSKYLEIPEEDIQEFYDSSSRTLFNNVETAFDKLANQSLIHWSHVKTVCVANTYVEYNDLGSISVDEVFKGFNEYDEEIYEYEAATVKVKKSYREATNDEVRLILRTEREVMGDLGLDNKQQVIRYGKWDQFQKTVRDILLAKANIIFYFDSYKIIYNEDHILEEVKRLEDLSLSPEEMKRIKDLLNINVADRQLYNAEKRQIRAIKERESNAMVNDKVLRRTHENYLDNSSKLVNTLIDAEHLDIKTQVRSIKL
jgi:hypothetical protein